MLTTEWGNMRGPVLMNIANQDRSGGVTLSAAKGLARGAARCFAALSMTPDRFRPVKFIRQLPIFYNIMSDPGCLLFRQSCHSVSRMHSVLVCRLAQSHAPPDGSQRPGSPPVPLAEQTHGSWDEQHTYQGRVDNHRDSKADADL